MYAADVFISRVFEGEHFLKQTEEQLDLADLVENEVKSTQPVLLCSMIGYDASDQVIAWGFMTFIFGQEILVFYTNKMALFGAKAKVLIKCWSKINILIIFR